MALVGAQNRFPRRGQYPAAEAVSCSILYLFSQFFGIGFIFVFRALVNPDGSTIRVNVAMFAVLVFFALGQGTMFRGKLLRREAVGAHH